MYRPRLVPLLMSNLAKVSSTYDQFPAHIHQAYYPHIVDEQMQFGSYPMPMTPSDFGSDHDSPYCSPRPPPHAEPTFAASHSSVPAERTHTTSGVSHSPKYLQSPVLISEQRRRAQNRAAQRAFRERKEKHARDLEGQLSVLTDKYNKLEVSHFELNAAYEKLRKTIELLTQDDEDAEGEDEEGMATRRRSSNTDTLRKLLEILHGEFKGITPVKTESP
jgi:AP-1-like factor